MATSSRHRGFRWDDANSHLELIVNGTQVGSFRGTGSDLVLDTNGLTVTAGGATITAGGVTVTACNLTTTAGDNRITAGNVRLGAVSAFACTEPTSAVVMKSGTAPVGAITTSGGIFSSDTVVRKIIAAGTASNVET